MRNRVARLWAIVATVTCVFGVVVATSALAPTARADTLPNGYSVTCTPNGSQTICNISGCPRVHEDEAGDVVHVKINQGPQDELKKGCNNATTETVDNTAPGGFTVSVQGCRKNFGPVSDDCGAWSDFKYTPPAQNTPPATVSCPAGSPVASVPQGQQCPAAQVNCPQGSPTPKAASLDQCAPVAPTKCAAGSVSDTVPAGQQCAAPTNAVSINITQRGLNANAAVTNNSGLPAHCSYVATKSGGIGPQEVDRTIDVGPNSTAAITDMLWPPLFTTYNATVKCTAPYDGKQVTIGSASQSVSG